MIVKIIDGQKKVIADVSPVRSVNGKTGVVVLDIADIGDLQDQLTTIETNITNVTTNVTEAIGDLYGDTIDITDDDSTSIKDYIDEAIEAINEILGTGTGTTEPGESLLDRVETLETFAEGQFVTDVDFNGRSITVSRINASTPLQIPTHGNTIRIENNPESAFIKPYIDTAITTVNGRLDALENGEGIDLTLDYASHKLQLKDGEGAILTEVNLDLESALEHAGLYVFNGTAWATQPADVALPNPVGNVQGTYLVIVYDPSGPNTGAKPKDITMANVTALIQKSAAGNGIEIDEANVISVKVDGPNLSTSANGLKLDIKSFATVAAVTGAPGELFIVEEDIVTVV